MKWIRWWGLAVFGVLMFLAAAGWYLLAPWLVKTSIEGVGAELLGAKVDVLDVELGLFPAKFKLTSLQLADPDAPMTNMLEIDEISLAVDSNPLLWKKLAVEEMIITGVKFSTPRQSSGKLEGGRESQQLMDRVAQFELPDIEQIDTNQLVKDADLLTTARIEKFNSKSTAIKHYWEEALDQKKLNHKLLEITSEFDVLKKRLKKNKLNLFKDRKKWKALKRKIKNQKSQFVELKKRLNADKKTISKLLKSVKDGPADDLKQLMNNIGMGEGGIENFSEKFLGPRITPWVLKGLDLAKSYQATADADNSDEDEEDRYQGLGRRVYFKDQQIGPEVLIKNIVLSGAQGSWTLAGKGNDIAVPPWQWKKPANLSGEFAGNGKANFKLSSEWKSDSEMITHISLEANKWVLENYILKQDEIGKYEILSAVINSKLTGYVTLETVDLEFNISFASPQLSFPDSLKGWQKQILQGVNQQQSIDISLTVTGDLLNPEIRLTSGLEKLFQQMLKARLAVAMDKIKQQLQNSISDKIGNVSKMQNMDLSAFQDQLNLGENQIADLLGKL